MQIFERKIAKVISGDKFKIPTPVSGSRYIRIAGFNAPEFGKKGYLQAKRKLQKFEGRKVEITPIAKSYGRTIAKVFYKEENLIGFL